MNYDGAVRYLLSLGRELAAPTQAAAAKFDLENTSVLAERLGRPDRAYPSAHIAGTNGKGSTAAFLESILRHAGFRTGLNSSPHLEKINERIRVGGEEISDADFAEVLTRIQAITEELLAAGKLRAHPTYFECVTAMAFEYFARQRVEFAIFEAAWAGAWTPRTSSRRWFPLLPASISTMRIFWGIRCGKSPARKPEFSSPRCPSFWRNSGRKRARWCLRARPNWAARLSRRPQRTGWTANRYGRGAFTLG